VRGGRGSGAAMATSPSAKPEQIQLTTEYLRPTSIAVARKARRKGPKQLCPVPGCKNPAAPVFGMVCSKHKDLPKTKINAYREARRAKKLKTA
jgi:hypothetical protein